MSGTTDWQMAGALLMSAAASQIIPGATSLSLRNNANNADNLIVTDAGTVKIRSVLGLNGSAANGSYAINMPSGSPVGASGSSAFTVASTSPTLTVTNGLTMTAGPIIGASSADSFSGTITITVDGTKPNTHVIPATSNTASTLTPSAAGTAGQWLYLVFTSDGTGGNVITFASTFKSNGTLTLGVSKKQVVSFLSDGTNWIEMARGPAV
jgi:hypothetical protein